MKYSFQRTNIMSTNDMKFLFGKMLSTILLIGIFLIFVFQAHQVASETEYFPVKYVRIYGAQHVNHHELENILTPLVTHNFFTIDMELIRDRLRQFSWVEDVLIKRIWPDSVDIIITEHLPVARWHDGSMLSANGDLFSQGEYARPAELPLFEGPEGTQAMMLQYFNDFNRELSPLHVKITQLELTPYQMWRMRLNTGMRVQLGHKNMLTRLSQFVKVYPKIIGNKAKDVEYVDLRYPNGIAIRWKNETHT